MSANTFRSDSENSGIFTICPNCETEGGYLLRIPRSWWRRLVFSKDKHYLCRECGYRFYVKNVINN